MTLEQRITLALQAIGADIKAILLKQATGPAVFADLFGDYVVSGLTTPTSASLSSTTVAGVAYVNGARLIVSAAARTYTASKDTYVDLTSVGTFTYTEVANAAAAPAQAANTVRLAKVVTSATAVTGVTDLRTTAMTLRNQLTVTPDGALQTTGAGQAGSIAGNARGTGAVDLQTSRTAAAQVASGANATVGGGIRNTSSGSGSTIPGGTAGTAAGTGSTVSGGDSNTASAPFATITGGYQAIASRYGQRGRAAGRFAVIGDAQASEYVQRTATADATATALTFDGAAPSAQGRFILNASQAVGFQGMLVAMTANGATAARWDINGLIVRGTTAASTRLVGTPTVVQSFADSGATGWAVAVTADTTNGALTFTVTGAAGISIRWVDSLLTTEVGF